MSNVNIIIVNFLLLILVFMLAISDRGDLIPLILALQITLSAFYKWGE